MVQVIIGENKGQGIKIASKQFWDENNDSMSVHHYVNDSLYAVSIAYGVYHYWMLQIYIIYMLMNDCLFVFIVSMNDIIINI